MYNIKFENYVPEPNPATSDRIVAAHYYAAWKKGAAGIHEGFNDLCKEYPDRTPLMGYYDEENPEVCDWEIKWAVEHGINCFIYCWYRRLDNMGKPVAVDTLRCGHGLHEALFNAKFRKYMKFAIMFEVCPRWGATDENDMLENTDLEGIYRIKDSTGKKTAFANKIKSISDPKIFEHFLLLFQKIDNIAGVSIDYLV